MKTEDFLIVGGGVMGMMTACQLAEAGHGVALLERGACGREASWAGGGILSPLYPWRYPPAISRLSQWAEADHPALAARLIDTTGIDPEYRQKGLLYLDVDEETEAVAWARRLGKPLQHVAPDFFYHSEPHLAPGFDAGLWMPTLASIRNPRLCQALRAQLRILPGAAVHEGVEVTRLRSAHGRIVAVETTQGMFSAQRTVICAGAWSSRLLEPLGIHLPIRPVKGQMMLFRAPTRGGRLLVERVVLRDGRYLIPRSDGRILIGSTLEEAGFDKTPTVEAWRTLRDSAVSMVPALAECAIEHHWAGLRPGTPDGIPFIGPMPDIDNLFVNAGHYRNGLVLAPAATRLLVDQLLERPPIMDPVPYQPAHRLGAPAAPA